MAFHWDCPLLFWWCGIAFLFTICKCISYPLYGFLLLRFGLRCLVVWDLWFLNCKIHGFSFCVLLRNCEWEFVWCLTLSYVIKSCMKRIKLALTTYILALRVNSALIIELTFSSLHVQVFICGFSFCFTLIPHFVHESVPSLLSLSFSFDMLICRFLREERRRKKKTKREFIVNKVCCGGADSWTSEAAIVLLSCQSNTLNYKGHDFSFVDGFRIVY